MTRILALLACLALAGAASASAAETSYPNRTVKIIVPFPPGGTSDTIARLVAADLQAQLGQPFIIENRGGAGTLIGTMAVARSEPDGYTLLWTTAPFAINPSLLAAARYDPVKDFVPIVDVAEVPLAMVVPAASPFKSLQDLVKAAKEKPGTLNYGSSGIGGSPHLTTELFSGLSKIKLTHVPYSGSAPAVTALLSGQTDLVFDTVFLVTPQVTSGNARALVQTGAERSPLLPDVPTLKEAGFAGQQVASWFSLAGPARTPPEVVEKLNAAVNKLIKSGGFRDLLLKQGAGVVGGTPADSAAHLEAEVSKWSKVIQEASIKTQ